MKGWGITLTVLGAIIAGVALDFDTTASAGGYLAPADVYNLGKLQAQLLTFVAGCALFVAGVVLAAAGTVIETMRRGVNFLDDKRRAGSGANDVTMPTGYAPPSASPSAPPVTAPAFTVVVDDEDPADREARLSRGRKVDRVGDMIIGVIVVVVAIVWLGLSVR